MLHFDIYSSKCLYVNRAITYFICLIQRNKWNHTSYDFTISFYSFNLHHREKPPSWASFHINKYTSRTHFISVQIQLHGCVKIHYTNPQLLEFQEVSKIINLLNTWSEYLLCASPYCRHQSLAKKGQINFCSYGAYFWRVSFK